MYNFGSLSEKRLAWEEVREKRRMINTKVWCVVGDFNSIRSPSERRNAGCDVDHKREMKRFNDFIESYELVDISMM